MAEGLSEVGWGIIDIRVVPDASRQITSTSIR